MLYLGCDHNGYVLKEKVKKYLDKKGVSYADESPQFKEGDDYPDSAKKVGKKVAKDEKNLGILICGSSFGVCVAANKVKGIRAFSPTTKKDAVKAVEDDKCNIMCLSGWNIPFWKAKSIVDAFLTTEFSFAERHVRRVKKISQLEK